MAGYADGLAVVVLLTELLGHPLWVSQQLCRSPCLFPASCATSHRALPQRLTSGLAAREQLTVLVGLEAQIDDQTIQINPLRQRPRSGQIPSCRPKGQGMPDPYNWSPRSRQSV